MPVFNRFDVCEAYAAFALLWGPQTPISVRLHRIRYSLPYNWRLEDMSENAKEIYGMCVKTHNRYGRLLVGFERLQRRAPDVAGSWIGTNNMPGGNVRTYLQGRGLLAAVECMCER